jgi:hypothetical protein
VGFTAHATGRKTAISAQPIVGESGPAVQDFHSVIRMPIAIDESGCSESAEMTNLERPPRGREEVPAQISRLLSAHELILKEVREAADKAGDNGDQGTNDLLVGDLLRTNELQVWFLAEHLVDLPAVRAD